jgi:hypothetical protein
MNTRVCQTILIIAFAAIITGCASQYAPARINEPYGFFSGILHGWILPFALLGKLVSWLCSLFGVSFLDSVTVIGRPNTGFFYYFGFVLGVGSVSGGSSQVAR